MSETEIAKAYGISTTDLRAAKTVAIHETKAADISMAVRLRDKGLSNVEVGKRMGLNESSVRDLLRPSTKEKNDILMNTANMLREKVDEKGYIDVGLGVGNRIGIKQTKLQASVDILKQEGYEVHKIQVPQPGSTNLTTVKVLAPPGTKYVDVKLNPDKIHQIDSYSDDRGRTNYGIAEPLSIDSKRVAIKYGPDGGAEADGLVYIRPGVKDVSIGNNNYAQIRATVDGTHYIKGMAVYKDDLPKGVDVMFNTNKSPTGNKLDALKKLSDDPDNPYGAVIKRQIVEKDKDGKDRAVSAMNLVNEEGAWDDWSKTLSAQMLSKQDPKLAKQQLEVSYSKKREELDRILELENPVIKTKLLQSYSDEADSSAAHLEAAGIRRSGYHVIIPVNEMKATEIYAPNYRHGERVALIRFPHGGTFEIPELVVNNKNPAAKKLLGDNPRDAVGINHKVAQKLSGADFDGDTVMVIPNNDGKIKSSPSLAGLKDFDPQRAYPYYKGMTVMTEMNKGTEMGKITNLIADMSIRGASSDELARAVRHSMVVIDAEKHKLNYKLSAQVNGIRELKEKYQGSPTGGASTLITRAGATVRVNEKKPRKYSEGGPIDKETGELIFTPTNRSWETVSKKGVVKTNYAQMKSKGMNEVKNAHDLSSGTEIEKVYADHANRMKGLANESRRVMVNTPPLVYNRDAAKAYRSQVDSLDAKLNTALQNKPLERQAQLIANSVVSMKKAANPEMTYAQYQKISAQAIAEARLRTGAAKTKIHISDKEWEAIQAGAVSNTRLRDIVNNADLDRVRELATPKRPQSVTPAIAARAKAMMNAGYSQADIAEALGVSVSTIKNEVM
jgi:hypothetical protein